MGLSEVLKARKKKKEEFVKEKVQNFITLINVYIQASSAATLGIMNLQQLPQLKVLKQKFKIQLKSIMLRNQLKSLKVLIYIRIHYAYILHVDPKHCSKI